MAEERKIITVKPTTTLDQFKARAAQRGVTVTTLEFGGKKQMHLQGPSDAIKRTVDVAKLLEL